jgi:2-succinyl-5-enolpyruvyl-6-hydroxy-3-cyclohexene-1-carboxylate synthase
MRGANGIDGTLSHAAGIAAGLRKPTLLIIGDLAFLHDLNGLTAIRQYAPDLTILLLNNNGGGIFHFLPVHKHEDARLFEFIHGTPQDLNLAAAAELFGVEWRRVNDPADLAVLIQPSGRPRVLEVRMDREQNHAAHSAWMDYLVKEVASR